jgi:hypothetical protein
MMLRRLRLHITLTVWSANHSPLQTLVRTHNREDLDEIIVLAREMVSVRHERTVDKQPMKKWLSAVPQTERASNREDEDGEIEDKKAGEGYGHRFP